MKKVAILGSCVSRDNFNTNFNADYKKSFSMSFLQNQSSVISAMAPRINIDEEAITGVNSWDKRGIIDDVSKSLQTYLRSWDADIFLVDLFSDARFGCLKVGESYLSYNDWKLVKSDYFQSLGSVKRLRLDINPGEYRGLFSDACNALRAALAAAAPYATVVLNSARGVDEYKSKDAVIPFKWSSAKLNQRWDELDSIFMTIFPRCIRIQGLTHGLISDDQHPWKAGPVHYQSEFYVRFLKELETQIQNTDGPL